ncbi:unnamed protein product [Linum trigynum]|uniref:Uncharacterized protein n=1 Tax=Linum trigynum TaxID=586398 RepID=A0AAV2EXQ8_9ROSI
MKRILIVIIPYLLASLLCLCFLFAFFSRSLFNPSLLYDEQQQHYYYYSGDGSRNWPAVSLSASSSSSSKFDFTPFLERHRYWQLHRNHHSYHERHKRPAADAGSGDHHDGEISSVDPRYGVDLRLVPTGPNPLHH